jgi:hypothetical protein
MNVMICDFAGDQQREIVLHNSEIVFANDLSENNFQLFVPIFHCLGHAVAQLVEALRYKPEGCGIDSRWCQWNFSLTSSFRPHYGPGVDSASNRNEYQEYLLGVKAAGA